MSRDLMWELRAGVQALPIGCDTWAPDPEAGPKWCDNCGRRRRAHTQVSPEFDPADERTW